MDPRFLLGAAAVGLVAMSSGKKRSSGGGSFQKRSPQATLMNPAQALTALKIPQNEWPEMVFEIPFGAGISNPIWPIVTNHSKKFVVSYRTIDKKIIGNGARRFMTDRGNEGRYHAGVDLYGNPDDPVIAMENGTIVNHYHFYHGSYALIVQCDSGLVINYGEVKKNSWKEFGLAKGSKVKKGRPIARVGLMSGGSHMCHFETYMPPTKKNHRYRGGDAGPLLNPTYYLLLAKVVSGGFGKRFASTNCEAFGSMNRPIPEELQHIAAEDERVGEAPGDSVLPELLTDDMWRPKKDVADGP